jgi:signal transduction histidine kinase
LQRGEPVVIADVQRDTPAARIYRETVGDALNLSFAHIRSWMAIPMRVKDRDVGSLFLEHGEPNAYTRHHAELALAIAQQAAIAIENARLYERAQEVAVLEERQRLSRELHDSVSQALYSIALGAKTARALVDRDPGAVADPLDFVLAQAERGLAEMRALIFELRPEALEQEGLTGALRKQVDALQARHHLEVELMLGEEPEAPIPAKEALYRIAQEAMQNTIKHPAATELRVSVTCSSDEIALEIRDNGKGFDTGASFPGHLGLSSMRERVQRPSGMLELESTPGAGTLIRARLPQRGSVVASRAVP